jgi:carbon starvation protein CstA
VPDHTYVRYAWVLVFTSAAALFVIPVISDWFGSSPESDAIKSLTGTTLEQIRLQSPGAALFMLLLFKEFGLSLLVLSAYAMATAAFPLRKFQRFGWYVSLLVPSLWLGLFAISASVSIQVGQQPLWAFLVFEIPSILGLLLPYRKFFPRKQEGTGRTIPSI